MNQVNESDLAHRLSDGSSLQPKRGQLPTWKKFMHAIDIFAFLPTPRTDPVSTKRSLIGSFLLFILFLGYIIYSFVEFITHNVPRVNQYTEADTSLANITAPEMAIAFFWGKDAFEYTINDPDIFTITMQQVTKFQDVTAGDRKAEVPLSNCNPPWIPSQGQPLPMLCATQPLNMTGLLYQTPTFVYPRFTINYCDPAKRPTCVDKDKLYQSTAGGRLILYLKNEAPDTNFVTGEDTVISSYQTYQFFLTPGLYNRAEISLQKQNITTFPNYLTSFFPSREQFLSVEQEVFYLTNTSYFDHGTSGFQIWVRLAQEIKMIDVVKVTLIDMISKWGAFWGVLFAAFAFYFLRFNSNKFYSKYPEWKQFDQKLKNIDPETQRMNDMEAQRINES